MATKLNLASGHVSCPSNAYTAIQPAAGENWAVLSLLGGYQAGNLWYVRQGASRISLGSNVFAAPGLYVNSGTYLEFYVPAGNAATYAQYQAQKLSSAFSVVSTVYSLGAGTTQGMMPGAGNVQKVGLIVGDVGGVYTALTDGAHPVEESSYIATSATALAARRTLWLSTTAYLRLRNAGAGTEIVLVSAIQAASTLFDVRSAVASVAAGGTTAFTPSAGEAWIVTAVMADAGGAGSAWYVTEGTNPVKLMAGGTYSNPFAGGKAAITSGQYLSYSNTDGSIHYAAVSAVNI
ncbi:MAG TPA: hypothetical protein VGL40_06930 [Bacillota bacterium]|jgi:hypothetical protein